MNAQAWPASWPEEGDSRVPFWVYTDEAIYLSTRVVALTAAPASVAVDLPIDLAHPRNQITTRELPRYLEYRHRVLEQLFAAEDLHAPAAV